MRRATSLRAVLVAVLAASALLIGAPMASAHSVVTGSDPADGSQLETGPTQVSVSFNEVPQSQFATLNVVGPDGNLWSKGDPRIEGQSIVVDVGELGPAGDYTIAYRVTSADGHPISGTLGFTLTTAGSGSPGAAADARPRPIRRTVAAFRCGRSSLQADSSSVAAWPSRCVSRRSSS